MTTQSPLEKCIFFDRDGTLIIDKIYLNDPDQIEYLDGAFSELKRLQAAGYIFIIVTNQSGVARGIVDPKNLEKIHQLIEDEYKKHDIPIAEFFHAPYITTSDHYYRKPKPGMIMEGALGNNIDLKQSWMIGDRMTDVEAGHRAGCKSILLSDLESPKDFDFDPPDAHVQSLKEMTDFILSHS